MLCACRYGVLLGAENPVRDTGASVASGLDLPENVCRLEKGHEHAACSGMHGRWEAIGSHAMVPHLLSCSTQGVRAQQALSNLEQSLPSRPLELQPLEAAAVAGQSAKHVVPYRATAAGEGEAAPSTRAATGASRQAMMLVTSRAVATGPRLAASGNRPLLATTPPTTRCVARAHLATWALLCLAQQAATARVCLAWCSQVAVSADCGRCL